ncbi:MAG: glycosyl hydrolase-related protein [Candidatus Sumerlaeota bacterium]|nr:glycosyl hydrolase-related protein [Candidatus Sumerlaeota bacterium]
MTASKTKPKEAHIISHTHWDREWYKPFQAFRFYLVRVIDDVLDMINSNPEYKYFHLDGQTIVLDDYAEIRPERVAELKRRLQDGSILVGPWYNLSDTFLVDGESLVRNMQVGHEMCHDWGVEPMQLGYAVDLFGHSSQMPQIFAGFGIKTATLFRGVNAQAAGAEFVWEGADGAECLVFRLDDHKAYSNFWYTFHGIMTHREDYDEETVRRGLEEIISETAAQTVTPYLLFMDGVDHATANPRMTRIMCDARRMRPDIQFIHSTWPAYMDKVMADIARGRKKLTKIKGELRIPNKDGRLNRLTVDVGSSRIHLKIMNRECETALLRYFEPLRVFAAQSGYCQPAGFLSTAWKYVLKNHPHDSICGCSIDQVHRDMEYRFDQARIIADECADDLVKNLAAKTDTTCVEDGEIGLFLFNPSQFERSGVVRFKVETREAQPPEYFTLLDAAGRELPCQTLAKTKIKNRVFFDPISCASHAMGAMEHELAADFHSIPAMGYSVIRMKTDRHPSQADKPLIAANHNVLENKFLRAEFDENGFISLLHKASGRCYNGLHNFEDCGEVGDLWVHKCPAADRVIRGVKSATVSLVRNGPLMATIRSEYVLSLPESASGDYNSRSEKMGELKVTSDFTLTRSSQFIPVETVISNTIRDHRLRVIFPTDIRTDVNYASSQFDVVKRSIKLMDTRGWSEEDSEIKPTQGFVDVNDGRAGLGILTFGLPEYAVIDDERRTLALTLLRALPFTVGTEGEDGPECMREIRMNYAICPHSGGWESAEFFRALDERNLGLKYAVVKAHKGQLPNNHSFITVAPANLVFSSLRNPRGRDNEAVLRVYNPTEKSIQGSIKPGFAVKAVHECDLKDEPAKQLRMTGGAVKVSVGPKKIKSLLLKY